MAHDRESAEADGGHLAEGFETSGTETSGTERAAVRKREVLWRAFAAVVGSVPQIRSWLGGQLRRRGVGTDQVDRMELMVTEAASNAVRHADGTQIVVMLDVNSHIEGAIRDQDPAPPTPRQPQLDDVGGRGLGMIQALADSWGVQPAKDGKWVWFRVNRRPVP